MVMLGMADYWIYHIIYLDGLEIFRVNVDKQWSTNLEKLLRPLTDDLRGVNLPDMQVALDDKDPMVWFGMMYDKKDRQRTARVT